jgi:hypothetical protein
MCTHNAKFFFEALGLIGTLSTSSGWLIKCMPRHGTLKLAVHSEQLHASANAGDVFHKVSETYSTGFAA